MKFSVQNDAIKIEMTNLPPSISTTDNVAISKLKLKPEELAALQTQGSITAARRGRHTTIYVLQFRLSGRQISKYIGSDKEAAAAVAAFLETHQRERRAECKLRARLGKTKELLRSLKAAVAPHLAAAGFHFHGDNVRRTRRLADQSILPRAP